MNTAVTSLVLVVVGLCTHVSGSKDIYRLCAEGNTGDLTILDVQLPGADCSSVPCRVVEGKKNNIAFTYRANTNLGPMTTHFFGILKNIPLPIPFLKRPNLCDYVDNCANKAGQTGKYQDRLQFPQGIAGMKVIAMVQVRNAADKQVACFTIPVHVVAEY